MSEPTSNTGFTMTERAAKRIADIVAGAADASMLRISVDGGGCSGFSYKYDLVAEKADDDLVIEGHGATIIVDQMSLMYLTGSEIDFVDELIGASFQIKNPNATASCGCGTSFSV